MHGSTGGVVLVILAAIDAAFSGDWSRIGILPKDTELGLRPLLGLLGLFHIVCGSVTALDATQKGYNPVPQTLKVGAFFMLPTIKHHLLSPAFGLQGLIQFTVASPSLFASFLVQVLAVGFLATVEQLYKDPAK